MRLLERSDTGAFCLVQVNDNDIPPYAILSHTWGATIEEVTFEDVIKGTGKDKPGFQKIQFCGDQAALDGLKYFWVDTCCIDKSSSAELSEAINSMFFWYKQATTCYAYLSDIFLDVNPTTLSKSKWFTRGWTLQELLAPKDVHFYSAEWQYLGNKTSLQIELQQITKIPSEALEGRPLEQFSIAERMSWAANRVTTRIEDIAYCLLGIFDVNMALLYGEREKAFFRLQQEIIQGSNDQSLFAWTDPLLSADSETGILARSPKQFEHSSDIVSLGVWTMHDSFTFTHNGLGIELWMICVDPENEIYLASLACCYRSSHHHSPGIYVKKLHGLKSSWHVTRRKFRRIHGDRIKRLSSVDKRDGHFSKVHIVQNPELRLQDDPIPQDLVVFEIGWELFSPEFPEPLDNFELFPPRSWNPQTNIFTAERPISIESSRAFGAILVRYVTAPIMTLFGLSTVGKPWVKVVTPVPFRLGDWWTYNPSGYETDLSEATIRGVPKMLRAIIRKARTDREEDRDVFTIQLSIETSRDPV